MTKTRWPLAQARTVAEEARSAGYRFRRSWVGRRLNLGLAYAHQGGRVVLAAISPRYRRYRYRMVEEALANLAVLLGEGYALRDVIEKYSNDDDEGKVAP